MKIDGASGRVVILAETMRPVQLPAGRLLFARMLGSSIGRYDHSLLNALTNHRASRSQAVQSFRAGPMTTLVAAAEVRPARARFDVDTLGNGHGLDPGLDRGATSESSRDAAGSRYP
jgi:hypothetical protein